MKKTSYPPLIILLDMLFVFLFIMILNEKKIIKINIPQDKLFKNAKIVYFDDKSKKYYDLNRIEYSFNSQYSLLLECEKQRECNEARKKFGNKINILLPDDIFDDMSKINMLAFGTEVCTQLNFFIKDDGLLDYQKILKENTCLLKIQGMDENWNK